MAKNTVQIKVTGLTKVQKSIGDAFERKKVAAFALASSYSVKMLDLFRERQSGNYYWQNRTTQAMNRVSTRAFRGKYELGFYIQHGVDYGVYLELANDRKHAALYPLVNEFAPKFYADLRRLF